MFLFDKIILFFFQPAELIWVFFKKTNFQFYPPPQVYFEAGKALAKRGLAVPGVAAWAAAVDRVAGGHNAIARWAGTDTLNSVFERSLRGL